MRRAGSITDLVVAALRDAGTPLSLDQLEASVIAAGWSHASAVKNKGQLRASIAAIPSKSFEVQRVGRATYDLSARRVPDPGRSRNGDPRPSGET